jgi:ABC-type multidrug transport system permease subunit
VVRRDFAITRSYRAGFVLDVFFGIMNLVVFFYVSRAVDLRAGSLNGASTYFAFASVGIVLTVVMQSATTGLAARIREEQLTGTLEVLVMQPLTPTQVSFGLTGFPYLFGVIRGGLYIAFAALFLDLDLAHASIAGFLLMLAATGMALAAIGIAMGGLVLVFKQGTALAGVVTFGLGLLSGTLFPRELLPGWVQPFGDLLPTRFAVDGLRDALFGGTGWQGDLYALTATAAILLPLSILFFSMLLGVVKRSGSLSQY